MSIQVQLDSEAFGRALEKAPEFIADELETALLESCKIVQGRARAVHRFRSRSGELERSIMFETYREASEAEVNTTLDYAVYQHQGTGTWGPKGKPYDIFPKNKKMLRFTTSIGTMQFRQNPYYRFHPGGYRVGGITMARGVTHPGVKPDPFLYNAADDSQAEVNSCFDRAVDRIVDNFGG